MDEINPESRTNKKKIENRIDTKIAGSILKFQFLINRTSRKREQRKWRHEGVRILCDNTR